MTKHIEIEKSSDVVIIGAGAAGLFSALTLAESGKQVTVLSEAALDGICASCWAQGGIAAAVSNEDSVNSHTQDTLKAGAGTADIAVVESLVNDAPDYINVLENYGVAFKKDKKTGAFILNREACHSKRRVLRANAGDGFGKELMRALTTATAKEHNIRFVAYHSALSLVREYTQTSGSLKGILAHNHADDSYHIYPANALIMATGGIGGLFSYTTNPRFATGRGIAMSARAGAVLADMEFVQFHPTALDIGKDPAPLATEALRGDGALLITKNGRRFVDELLPRDEVSRAVFAQISKGNKVFLDCTKLDVEEFPALTNACRNVGIEPAKEPVPIHPAAHYHMGGVATDLNGRSSISGLWACGEVASTGLHGANRLASNSLMEAVVMAGHAAIDINEFLNKTKETQLQHIPKYCQKIADKYIKSENNGYKLRQIMTKSVGLLRNEKGLTKAITEFRKMENITGLEDMALVAKIVATAALQREESRGGHWRIDFPQKNKMWQHRSFTTLKEINITNTKDISKEKAYA